MLKRSWWERHSKMKYLRLSEEIENKLMRLSSAKTSAIFSEIMDDYTIIKDSLGLSNWAEFSRYFNFNNQMRSDFVLVQLETKNAQRASSGLTDRLKKNIKAMSINILDSLAKIDQEIIESSVTKKTNSSGDMKNWKALEIKTAILANHRDWLKGISENIEEYPNSLDVAESANQADFRECMFLNTPFDETVAGENATFNAMFDNSGFTFSVYKNEDVSGNEDWFLKLEDEFNFTISWREFDEQVDSIIDIENVTCLHFQNCVDAVRNQASNKSNTALAIDTVREFETAGYDADDKTLARLTYDHFQTQLTVEDINSIRELTRKEMDMDIESIDNTKELTMEDVRKLLNGESLEDMNLDDLLQDLQESKKVFGSTAQASEGYKLNDVPDLDSAKPTDANSKNTNKNR